MINDGYICKAFDSLGRLNNETKYILENDEVRQYLLTRFVDSFDIQENARRIKFNIFEIPKCPICGNNCKYIGGKRVYAETCVNKTCVKKLFVIKKLNTFKQNHNGLTSSFQLPGVYDKAKETFKLKYGVENPAKSEIIKEKSKQTCLERYGVEYSFKSENNKEKSKQTKLNKYGDENYNNIEKIKQTCLIKYGVKFGWNNGKEKITCLEKYGVDNYSKSEECKKRFINKLSQILQKEISTKRKNGTFNTSKSEQQTYELLKTKIKDVEYQYKDNERYPFNCDFYIPSFDLFIECQYSWTHGGHPYNKENDKEKIELWENKAKKSKYYQNAIETWTIRDVSKRETAKKNNLNYLEFFTIIELQNWLNTFNEYEGDK